MFNIYRIKWPSGQKDIVLARDDEVLMKFLMPFLQKNNIREDDLEIEEIRIPMTSEALVLNLSNISPVRKIYPIFMAKSDEKYVN